jgi:RNA recognition motif-containing protein
MLKKVYIGNLPFDTTEKQVRELFAPYGDVFAVDMVIDYETNQFRGFCFVELEEEAADEAIAGLKGHKIEGRNLKVSAARSDKTAPGNHVGSNMHLRTSRSLFGGDDEFGRNGRGNHGGQPNSARRGRTSSGSRGSKSKGRKKKSRARNK